MWGHQDTSPPPPGRGCGPALPASGRETRFLGQALAYVLAGLSC